MIWFVGGVTFLVALVIIILSCALDADDDEDKKRGG